MTRESIVPQTIKLNNAYAPGLIIKGALSQSANLQEWQNSSGTTLAAIGPNGTVYMGSNGGANIANFYNGTSGYGAGAIAADGTFNINAANIGFPYISSGAVVTVNATSATSVPLTARGYASQTADLQQWQDSSGQVMSKVTAFGDIYSLTGRIFRGSQDFNSAINVLPGNTTQKGIVIRGLASQTADLQQWQNSAGTVLAKVSSDGKLVVVNDGETPSSLILTSLASPSITTTSTANSYGFTISGSGASTGSNVGMSFSAWGGLGFNGVAVPGAAIWFTRTGSYSQGYLSFLTRTSGAEASPLAERMRVGETGTITVAGFTADSTGLIVKGAASQTADLQQWQNSAGGNVLRVTAGGGLLSSNQLTGINESGELTTGFTYVKLGTASTFAVATSTQFGALVNIGSGGNATFVPLAIRGSASQTANLQEWQNSAGTVLANIGPSGILSASNIGATSDVYAFYGRLAANHQGTFLGQITGVAGSASTIGLVIRGAASQTANLFEVQDSTGAAMTWVSSTGGISLPRGSTFRFNAGIGVERAQITSNTSNDLIFGTAGGTEIFKLAGGAAPGGATITVGTTTAVGLIVKGAASQTADLLQLRNSAGTAIASINASGDITTRNIYASTSAGYYTAQVNILPDSAAKAGIVVRGAASQTANLQEWQNSAGTVLARVDSSGNAALANVTLGLLVSGSDYRGLYGIGGGGLTTSHGAFAMQSWSTTIVTGVLRAAVSQTADLQQWQNSAGTVLANVTNNGFLNVPAILENPTISATAATGTINYELLTNKSVTYYTSNASANWTLNIRGNSSTTLDSLMAVGQSLTVVFMVTQGSTAYYQSGLQIDGSAVTPKWQGGVTPTFGNASGVDVYSITIMKTASATFTAFESQTRFA